MQDKIILYSTDCPKCKILKAKLDDTHVEYTICSDIKEMLKKGFKSAPILEVNGNPLIFLDAINYTKEIK